MYLRQSGARNAGEVVMLHVVAHVPCEPVEGPVVGVGLVASHKREVFCDEVPCQRVEAGAQQGAQAQVQDRLAAQEVPHAEIKRQLKRYVQRFECFHGFGVDEKWSYAVENALSACPQ